MESYKYEDTNRIEQSELLHQFEIKETKYLQYLDGRQPIQT